MGTAHFKTTDRQKIKIYYTVKENMEFSPENYETSEKFESKIAETIMDNVDGEIIDWEIIDGDTNDTQLLTNTEYFIEISAKIRCYGTCYYDPGRLYGPMEDCYPPEIDDVEYEEGQITCVNQVIIEDLLPELDEIKVTIGDPDYDGEIEIDDDY